MKKKGNNLAKKVAKKLEKNIKKNWKKIIFWTALIVFVVSIILLITGIRVRFEAQDDLVIMLSPMDKSITLYNNEKSNVTFTVSIQNSVVCKASCEYSFYDRSEQKEISTGKVMPKNKESFNFTYEVVPYSKGEGQKIYNFDIKCNNIKSFLCNTKITGRRRSSFVTLNYKITPEEDKLKEKMKAELSKSFGLINNAGENMQIAYNILTSGEFIGKDPLFLDYAAINKSLIGSTENALAALSLWSLDDYSGLQMFYNSKLKNNSDKIYYDSAEFLAQINSVIAEENSAIANFNKIKNLFFYISKENNRFIYPSETVSQFFSIYDQINETKKKIDSYEAMSDFLEDIVYLEIKVNNFNSSVIESKEETENLGKNYSLIEYGKKCYLGYCVNLTLDVCYDLKKIISEYNSTRYDNLTNVSIENISYYSSEEGKVKIAISNETLAYYHARCLSDGLNYSFIDDALQIKIDKNISTEPILKNELVDNLPRCCVYGKCSPCCTTEVCKDDPLLYPVLLVHGHSLLRQTSPEPLDEGFFQIQYQMQEDGYINAGVVGFDSFEGSAGEWGMAQMPIVVRVNYYYDFFYSVGSYVYITKSAENIDGYAIRLKEIIDLVKYKTGKDKVNIIAHSMGGLVARRYIQIFGEDSVDKIITIATPNAGISGDIKSFCRIFGEKRECEDMYDDSQFIQKLNSPILKPKTVKIYTISGSGCPTDGGDGDGVVTLQSSLLSYAKSYIIKGECTDSLKKEMHISLLDIDKYPAVYEDIKEILDIG